MDFSTLRTYAWTEPEQRRPLDVRIDREFLDRNVRDAVDAQFARSGFRQAPESQADFLVTYVPRIKRKTGSVELGGQQPYGAGLSPADDVGDVHSGDTGTVVEEYDEGRLSILILPRHGGAPIWSGSARAVIFPEEARADRAKRLQRAAKQIVRKFPP
jgi:hypothetical protein